MAPTKIAAQATSTQHGWKHSRQQSWRCLHNSQCTAVSSSAVIGTSSSIVPRNLSNELVHPMNLSVVRVEFHPNNERLCQSEITIFKLLGGLLVTKVFYKTGTVVAAVRTAYSLPHA